MSSTKMLIDATHPEETRVVVQRSGRVEEFDFESAARKLLRGNIYLAKVTRVEPSLQAAFVDYGGNRHGFLAFNEIHPDYYQIPVADRQALIDEEAAVEAELEAAADRRAEALAKRSQRHQQGGDARQASPSDEDDGDVRPGDGDAPHIVDVEEDEHIEEVGGEADGATPTTVVAARSSLADDVISEPAAQDADDVHDADDVAGGEEPHASHHEAEDDDEDDDQGEDVDQAGDADQDRDGAPSGHGGRDDVVGDEDHADHERRDDDETALAPLEGRRGGGGDTADGYGDPTQRAPSPRSSRDFGDDSASRPRRRPRSYKIQEVIKRRQIILVQVVKEERGNKGAALTTYLSLAGRYTVLMPNTARGGGISRKITQPQDRKRLKSIAQELEVPEGMGLIIRTAGAARTKQEIKRDFEYLLRLWESVRELTLQSTAPSLVYEEGDLVKRSIRDLYNKDVEEVVVAGEVGHRDAADFMRMLMPSHSKNVIEYKDPTPLFTKYGVERQLNAMFLPQVTLRSGGYIVINQTEALVAIDVNSGKSTREFSIEETALATNLEASDEIARQLKLRDLAGLIVIDFIDMEEKRNNRSVERRLKDALRFDRARIQLGRISHFGLMEMSRQRLRTGVLEGSTSQCPHCQGTGIIRSTESIALAVLRGLEDAITAGANTSLIATTTPAVALYILNSKRAYVTEMEARHGHVVTILGSDRIQGANFTVERGAAAALPAHRPARAAVNMNWGFEGEGEDEAPGFETAEIEMVGDNDDRDVGDGAEPRAHDGEEDGGRQGGGGRRRRRGRGRRGDFGDDRGPRSARGPDHERLGGGAPEAPENGGGDPDAGEDDAPIETGELGEGEAGDELRGERARKRRRGRRGGRRGRDRDGAERAPGGEAVAADADGAVEPSAQPSFNGPAVNGDGAARAAPRERGRRNEPRADRQRGERLWEAPAARERAIDDINGDLPPVAMTGSGEEPADAIARDGAPAAMTPPAANPAPQQNATTRRHEIGSSEPRIERVVVGKAAPESEAPAAETPAQPQRKGWWQRRFGAE